MANKAWKVAKNTLIGKYVQFIIITWYSSTAKVLKKELVKI
jgi:hypothetical protein